MTKINERNVMTKQKREFNFTINGKDPDDIVAENIIYFMNQIDDNPQFHKDIEDLSVKHYICKYAKVSERRLDTLLSIGKKRKSATPEELNRIATVLGVPIYHLFYTKELKLNNKK